MAASITAPVQIQDFVDWTGCKPSMARAVLASTSCPECEAEDPDEDGFDNTDDPDDCGSFQCLHIWHMRADSGDWA